MPHATCAHESLSDEKVSSEMQVCVALFRSTGMAHGAHHLQPIRNGVSRSLRSWSLTGDDNGDATDEVCRDIITMCLVDFVQH
jgi:hypothetical protein